MDEQQLEGEISLNDIFRTIKRRFWLILLILIISVIASILYVNQITPLYKSTCKLLVQVPNSNSMQTNPYSDYSSSERWTQTYAEMIKSDSVLQAVADKIIFPRFTISSLKSGLSVEAIRNTLLLNVSFTYPNKGQAKNVVDRIAQVFTEKTKELFESNISASTQKLDKQIKQLDIEIESINEELSSGKLTPQDLEIKRKELQQKLELRGLLYNQYQEQKLYEAQISPSVKIYQEGSYPGSPDNIKKPLTYSIAGVLGIFIGVLIAFVLEYFDDTIKTEEDIKKIYKVKVLGVIPRFNEKSENYYYSKNSKESS